MPRAQQRFEWGIDADRLPCICADQETGSVVIIGSSDNAPHVIRRWCACTSCGRTWRQVEVLG